MDCQRMRRLQISFFFIFFFLCLTSVVYSEELAATPADAVKDSAETVKKHIESVKNLINEIKGKTEIFKKQADTVVQKKADVINSLADIIQSQVEIVKSEAAKFVEKIKKTDVSSVDEATIKSWNETIESFKKRASDYSLQADKLKQDVDEFKKALVEPGYDTKHFFIHTGVVTLNPYTITRDPNDLKDPNDKASGKFKLRPAGESDTHVFLETLFRRRTAWLNKSCPREGWLRIIPDDYEVRLGFYGLRESKGGAQGAAISGSGDAGGEMNIGWNIFKPAADSHLILDIRHTLNIEAVYGLITDRAALDIHNYYGLGIVSVWGVPFKPVNNTTTPRNLEILGGIYLRKIKVPAFSDSTSTVVEEMNGFPKFSETKAITFRLNFHLPFGKNGFLTMAGQFNNVAFFIRKEVKTYGKGHD